ncbi:MAG: hypothetical protein KFF77_04075 [Bacteroidetes bacterium]|nr:hypothetical protein [Bacteroidota bacterium]
MTNDETILQHCTLDSAIISRFVDDFLVYYCDNREGLKKHFDREWLPYAEKMKWETDELYRRVLMQYVASRLFRRGGFARAYRGHMVMQMRDREERAWLETQVERPWHWSFCRIHSHQQKDFYEMSDVCTGEHFLLYSPAMTRTLDDGGPPMMWLLLLTDNGMCRQTYGPLLPMRGLFPHDILLLTRQLHPHVHRLDQIPALVENDPIPYLKLWGGSQNPVVVHKKDIIMFNRCDLERVRLDVTRIVSRFSLENAGGVAWLRLKYWSRQPHFAEAWYDIKRDSLIATAMTDRGWEKLVTALREAGVDIPIEADIRGSINATLLIGKILGRDLAGIPYRDLFEEPVSQGHQESLDRINDFIAIWVEAWNTGGKFNLEEAARSAGIDPQEARSVLAVIESRFKNMPPPRRR